MLGCMQVVVNGETQCFRQIVTVSNSDGRVIACDKPHLPMVYYLLPDQHTSFRLMFGGYVLINEPLLTLMLIVCFHLYIQIRSSDTSTAESGSEVEEMGSPKVNKSYVQPRLTPVCEEVSSVLAMS